MGRKLDGMDILLIIICIFISPLAVFLKVGCTKHFIINIILWILIWIPGMGVFSLGFDQSFCC